jgi:flagellar biosynthetic protein FlhB
VAENQDDKSREDLSDEASPHKVEEYRKKGMVSQSREVSALAALLAAGAATYLLSPKIGVEVTEYMKEVFRTDLSSRLDLGSGTILRGYLMKALQILGATVLPICLAGFVLGIAGSFAQIGSIFSTDPLTPDFSKINPLSGLQRMFSMKQAYDGIRLIIKMTVVIAVAYGLVKTQVLSAPSHLGQESGDVMATYAGNAKSIFLSLIGVLVVFAGIDFWLQRWEFSKNVRLTKQEAKQEHREREGDPQIKARIRAVQREMARRRMMQAVRKADVIITNPTHIAVALVYDKTKMAAPRVVAKGADFLAQRIKKIAAEAGVPLVENVPLARTLYKTVKINQGIPRVLYQAVAEVLAYVYKLKNRGV